MLFGVVMCQLKIKPCSWGVHVSVKDSEKAFFSFKREQYSLHFHSLRFLPRIKGMMAGAAAVTL